MRINIMQPDKQALSADKNFDRLVELLDREIKMPDLAKQIPNGAHILHGAYNDAALTRTNLKLASKILLGMALGYVEEAPLVMVFEQKPGQFKIVDLITQLQKQRVQMLITSLQDELSDKAEELIAA